MTGFCEAELAVAVVDTLLREDYGGLSRYVSGNPPVLRLPGGRGPVLPLRADGFLADLRVARPLRWLGLDDVSAALAAIGEPDDAEGVAAFGDECRQALATLRLRERCLPGVREALRRGDRDGWLGPGGSVRWDALAAARPHPVYPTSAGRLGFTDEDSVRYAPEFWPEFELNWAAVPRTALISAGRDRSRWWPEPAAVGLAAGLAASHELMPVHPLTARVAAGGWPDGGWPGGVVLAPGTCVRVRPTLSVRTVAVTEDPAVHLKLPLPVSTLGVRNRRAIVPGTLADGALVHRVLAEVVARDRASLDAGAGLGAGVGLGRLLLADDGDYVHAGHPYLGYLLRRLPDGLGPCRVVPVAALLAPSPGGSGRLVIDDLAPDGLGAFFAAYLDLVFGIGVRLFVRYGIALESHQQNAAVVAGPASALRLLVKDFDGALINRSRLAAALGPAAPDRSRFADPRLLTGSDDALADVFITITVHLCAGALAFGLRDRLPLAESLAMIRRALAGALDRCAGEPAVKVLRARVLDADRLPGKAMVTAGTLRDKTRTGARDINKCYGPAGPNYLRAGRG